MAIKKSSNNQNQVIESHPKKTRQGSGAHTKCSASSRNRAAKRYKGQGKG